MRARTAAAVGVAAVLVSVGCGGDSSPPPPNTDDEATKQGLADAYAALEDAAAELEGREFRRYEKKVLKKEEFRPDPTPTYFALITFFSENGDEVPTIISVDPTNPDQVDVSLSSIEFHEDTEGITMIAPSRLGHSPPSSLIEAGVMFAAMSRSGQIFCLASGDEEAQPCDPPDVEDLKPEP